MSRHKAIFLDRDGTLIVDKDYLSDPEQVELLPGAKEAVERFLELGYKLFLFTNQSGIGRGYFGHEAAEACNLRTIELLGFTKENSPFEAVCIAPEHPDEAPVYRKPSPRFILESIEAHGIDERMTYMVGDKASDVQAGLNAGVRAVFLSEPASKPLSEELANEEAVESFAQLIDFAKQLEG